MKFNKGSSRGPDAKARLRAKRKGHLANLPSPSAKRDKRAKSKLTATVVRQDFVTTGEVKMRDYAPSGSVSGLVIGATGPQGGISVNPLVKFGQMIRHRMQPLRIPATTVTDATGKVIATITVDPVTGKRTRTPVEGT